MKTFVLYTRATRKTGAAIARALDADHGSKAPNKPSEYKRLIRWGASHAAYLDQDIGFVINNAHAILKVSNRHHMMQTLSRSEVMSPYYSSSVATLPNTSHYVLRTRFGRWGNDIIMLSQEEMQELTGDQHEKLADQGYFAVSRWLADFEVRIHIVNNIGICMQIKRHVDDDTNTPRREWIIRNRKNNWRLYPLSMVEATGLGIDKGVLRRCAKTIMTVARLDFGVVDFLVRSSIDEAYMTYKALEANTAPGLEDSTLDLYAQRINEFERPSLLSSPMFPNGWDEPPNEIDEPLGDEDDYEPPTVAANSGAPLQFTVGDHTVRPYNIVANTITTDTIAAHTVTQPPEDLSF